MGTQFPPPIRSWRTNSGWSTFLRVPFCYFFQLLQWSLSDNYSLRGRDSGCTKCVSSLSVAPFTASLNLTPYTPTCHSDDHCHCWCRPVCHVRRCLATHYTAELVPSGLPSLLGMCPSGRTHDIVHCLKLLCVCLASEHQTAAELTWHWHWARCAFFFKRLLYYRFTLFLLYLLFPENQKNG